MMTKLAQDLVVGDEIMLTNNMRDASEPEVCEITEITKRIEEGRITTVSVWVLSDDDEFQVEWPADAELEMM